MKKKRESRPPRPPAEAPPAQAAPAAESPVLGFLQRHPHGVVLACFFLSGATGLVYEVVWSRRLTLVFGVTVLAYSTVLAAFLGGLALGSMIFGRIVDRRKDALRLYALLEAGVGIFCFLTPWLFTLVQRAFVALYPAIEGHLWQQHLVHFVLAAAVMFPPTILMGGTLPVLSRAVVRGIGQVGSEVAALYGINTLGAVVGSTAAGFFLLPSIGLKGSIYLAAVLNLGVALIAYALYSLQPRELEAAQRESEPEPARAVSRGPYAALLVAYGLSGAAALIYEVVWTRILALAFGTSVYAFAGMLAAFLAGLGIGSMVPASRRWSLIDRLREPLVWFGVIEAAIAVTVTFLTPLLDHMPFVFLALFRLIGPRFWLLQLAELSVAFLVMLPPAALMGFAFPLVTRLATESIGVLGRRLSAIYSANTLGTVVGSFTAGFVLIPLLGARHALAVGVALNGIVGLAYLAASFRRHPRLAYVGLALTGATALGWALLPDWNKAVLSSGAYIYPGFYLQGNAREAMEAKELLYYRDSLTAAISVTRVTMPGLDKPLVSLQINGKTDASTKDLSTQILFAHLPALLRTEPRSALVIGLASGCTVGALELHPEFRRIDCVEIEPDMVRVTDFFRDVNHDCMRDPRVRLFLNDARNYVLVAPERYDVLTSEPSNPWIAGVANLFTREHFELCRRRLSPTGIFCQWIPLYNLAPDDLRCIVATFREVFPNCSMWLFPTLPTDAYLIATPEPLSIDMVGLAPRAAQPRVAGDLNASGLRDAWDLLGGYLLGPEGMGELARLARLNTDDFPVLEFSSPLRLHTDAPRQTTLDVLRLGAPPKRLPLGRCGVATADGYRSALVDVTLSRPWKVRSEEAFVLHSPDGYASNDPARAAQIIARIDCTLGGSSATLFAGRVGTPLADASGPVEPTTPAARTLQVGDHEVSLWPAPTKPAGPAWVARWVCPARGRVYVVVARAGAPSPEEALAGVGCRH